MRHRREAVPVPPRAVCAAETPLSRRRLSRSDRIPPWSAALTVVGPLASYSQRTLSTSRQWDSAWPASCLRTESSPATTRWRHGTFAHRVCWKPVEIPAALVSPPAPHLASALTPANPLRHHGFIPS